VLQHAKHVPRCLTETMCTVTLQACFAHALHSREVQIGHAHNHIQHCESLLMTSTINKMVENSNSIKQFFQTNIEVSLKSLM